MTTEISPTTMPQKQPATRTSAGARRRTRRSSPGQSLLARGEPIIWLAGGALSVCVVMVFGLLALVLYSGTTTFWPTKIVHLRLLDDSVVMGEVTRSESYLLTADNLQNLSPGLLSAARQALDGQEQVKAHRRLVRIGNYELTNNHFDWVSDFAIAPAGESTPPWAVVLERVEWGRFYGTPSRFVVRYPREVPSEELRLQQALQFLQMTPYQLPSEQQQPLQARLTELQTDVDSLTQRLKDVQRKNIATFRATFEQQEGGQLRAVLEGDQTVPIDQLDEAQNLIAVEEVWSEPAEVWQQHEQHHETVRQRFRRQRRLEKYEIGRVNRQIEDARLQMRDAELKTGVQLISLADEFKTLELTLDALDKSRNEARQNVETIASQMGSDHALTTLAQELLRQYEARIDQQAAPLSKQSDDIQRRAAAMPAPADQAWQVFLNANQQATAETRRINEEIDALKRNNQRFQLQLQTADGRSKLVGLSDVVRGYPANQLDWSDKLSIYTSRWLEFVGDDPREANSEGGVFPAIWGTVAMTLIMSIIVAPFGVLAALYLREYARAGWIISTIRIAINNLAGVPSIVFGVFGLGFFCYMVGAFVDGGAKSAGLVPLPPASWWFTLLGLAVVAMAAFLSSLVYRKTAARHGLLPRLVGATTVLLWLVTTAIFVLAIVKSPYFDGLFATSLPNPTFGKGGLLWASLTLALLTLPVVIVATEEALSAVPNSLREGSYASGASKWQTLRRIVLPHALPGIMTGMILAMARGAGEVAPLMLVGAVKLAPELPVDSLFPFVHADRSFMHLGFHIFDLGFQSQNSEAAKPMVFTTTLILILIVALLNIAAISLRAHLKRRFQASYF